MFYDVARFVESTFHGRLVEQAVTNQTKIAFVAEAQETDIGYRESGNSVLEHPELVYTFDTADNLGQFVGHASTHELGQ